MPPAVTLAAEADAVAARRAVPAGQSASPFIVVQGSSRSWSGGRDYCVSAVDGTPIIAHTLKKLRQYFPKSRIVIAAPEFDRGGFFDGVVAAAQDEKLGIVYAHDSSPLRRIVAAASGLRDDDLLLKVDALHFVFDAALAQEMLRQARNDRLDCVKPADDFPAQLGCEVYRYGALKALAARITAAERNFEIHPKFYFFKDKSFKAAHALATPHYSDDFLRQCRTQYAGVYAERWDVTKLAVPVGDQISFHYRHATQFLGPHMTVLDIACGNGFGAKLVAPHVKRVIAADLSAEVIATAAELNPGDNISYVVDDITALRAADREFDAVLTFETFEHVDTSRMLGELKRVLKPGGLMIMSTPQNALGQVPICAEHLREYSLEELLAAVQPYFEIVRVDGIKAGTITIEGDPRGANTFLVARKPG